MDMGTVALLLAGLVTPVVGGGLLARGAGALATAIGMSPLVVAGFDAGPGRGRAESGDPDINPRVVPW